MGSVYLGWNPDGQPAAVKVVRHDFLQDPDFRARFRREINAASRVSGPWISRVLDADPDAEQPWLATEYVAGPTLDAAVTRFGPLPTETVAVLAECLGQALEAVHEAGVVHRDIKPNNILLAADGPRLIDFGIARATDDTKLTATHAGVFGVAGFIAPERIERQALLPAGDVFAGGAVLAFAATGKMAFGGGEPVTVAYRVVHSEPDLANLPTELLPLVTSCLAKDPAQRPDAGQMAEAAARVRGDSDWPGVPTTPVYSEVSRTADTYEIAVTWLPEPLARHTVRDYDLSAGFAAAETARLNLGPGGGGMGMPGPGPGTDGRRFDTPRFETPRFETPGAAAAAASGGSYDTPGPQRPALPFETPVPQRDPLHQQTMVPAPPSMSSPYRPDENPDGGGPRRRDGGRSEKPEKNRRKPLIMVGGGLVLAAAVVAGVMLSGGGSKPSGGTALQGATNGRTSSNAQSASGKDASDISGAPAGGGDRSGDNLGASSGVPASGSSRAPSSAAGAPSATGGAPSNGQQPPSSATGAKPPSSSAAHSTTAAPPASTSQAAPPPTTSVAPPAPAPVPCSGTTSTSQGTGYYCTFDTPGDGSSGGSPVLTSSGSLSGYLHQGKNWVICQATGRTEHSGQYYNNWWGWTASDHGGWGWVNAVNAAGGDNDGGYGGVPMCNGAHGSPPA